MLTMRPRNLRRTIRASLPILRRAAPRCLLGLLTGCHGAATPYISDPGNASPRRAVLARQLIEDSAHAIANRPLSTSWHFLADTTNNVCALTGGEFGKRVLLPLHGTPDPLTPCEEKLDL